MEKEKPRDGDGAPDFDPTRKSLEKEFEDAIADEEAEAEKDENEFERAEESVATP